MPKLQISKDFTIEIEHAFSEFKEEASKVYITVDAFDSTGHRKTVTINIDIPEGHTIDELDLAFSEGNGWKTINF